MRNDSSPSKNPLLESLLNSPCGKGFIRKKAKQLIGRAGFTETDLEDIEQDIYVKLLKHLGTFDPKQSHPNAFIKTIVERYVANILRDKLAEKRNHRRVCSLNIVVGNDDDCEIELSDTISDRESDARLFRSARNQREETELRMDVAEVLQNVSDELRDALVRVMAGDSVSQIARDMGIARTTLQDRVRKLQERFEDVGLKDYL